jgi:hypothetical protein
MLTVLTPAPMACCHRNRNNITVHGLPVQVCLQHPVIMLPGSRIHMHKAIRLLIRLVGHLADPGEMYPICGMVDLVTAGLAVVAYHPVQIHIVAGGLGRKGNKIHRQRRPGRCIREDGEYSLIRQRHIAERGYITGKRRAIEVGRPCGKRRIAAGVHHQPEIARGR